MSPAWPCLVTAAFVIVCSPAAPAAERIDLSPQNRPNSLTHVTIQLEVGGHLVRAASDGKEKSASNGEQKLPISVVAKLAFDEHRLVDLTTSRNAGTPLAVRYYEPTQATIKVGEGGLAPKLAEEHRLIVVEASTGRPLLYCADGLLSRDELDLIDVVGDPLAADRLLPTRAVSEGDTWVNDASVMGPLLTLDTVAACEVQSVLDSFNADFAKIRLAGTVHGTADGASTQHEIRGVYLFDRRLRRVSRINVAIRENRSIGGATPGVAAVAKVQATIAPLAKSAHLSDDVLAKVKAGKRTSEADLSFESLSLGFRVKHDRQWYTTAEGREAVTFRRIDNGDLAAQCTLTQLPSKSEGRQTTLEQFQKDVTFSLGKTFGELVSSREWENAAGLHCYELVVRGLVEELPVEWHYYLVAPESGPRMSVVVTIEKPMIERVGDADRKLVESLELFPIMTPAKTAAKPTTKITK